MERHAALSLFFLYLFGPPSSSSANRCPRACKEAQAPIVIFYSGAANRKPSLFRLFAQQGLDTFEDTKTLLLLLLLA